MLTNKQLLAIHTALHGKYRGVKVAGKEYLVKEQPLRHLVIDGVKWMVQNPRTSSSYATRAQAGEQITWGIREGQWALIENGTIVNR